MLLKIVNVNEYIYIYKYTNCVSYIIPSLTFTMLINGFCIVSVYTENRDFLSPFYIFDPRNEYIQNKYSNLSYTSSASARTISPITSPQPALKSFEITHQVYIYDPFLPVDAYIWHTELLAYGCLTVFHHDRKSFQIVV